MAAADLYWCRGISVALPASHVHGEQGGSVAFPTSIELATNNPAIYKEQTAALSYKPRSCNSDPSGKNTLGTQN
jgi:hypothetical protein